MVGSGLDCDHAPGGLAGEVSWVLLGEGSRAACAEWVAFSVKGSQGFWGVESWEASGGGNWEF